MHTIAFVQNSKGKISKKQLIQEVQILNHDLREGNLRMEALETQLDDLSSMVFELSKEIHVLKDSLAFYEINDTLIQKKSTTNYFGSGGSGNNTGTGKTPILYGNIGELSKVYTNQIDVESRIGIAITLNAEGKITDCKSIKSVTNCKSQAVINEVIRLVKLKMYGNKDPGATIRTINYTVKLNPT
jgi:hypothetical protein